MHPDSGDQAIKDPTTKTTAPAKLKFPLPSRKAIWVGLACLIPLSLVALGFRAITAETAVAVSCASIKGGYECKVTPSGARIVNSRVCWEIHDVCENGVKSMVAKCIRGTLEPGQEMRSLIGSTEFSNHASCDKLSARAIESVSVEAVRQLLTPQQK